MADVVTARLRLHPIDADEGERIFTRKPGPTDNWADDFPGGEDVLAVSAYLRASIEGGGLRPWGYYLIVRSDDQKAVGGIGFNEPPEAGCAEVGYGLVPSARGNGYGSEALRGFVGVAARFSLSKLVAYTTEDNVASQRTLERAGFHLVGSDGELRGYELALGR